MAGGVKIELPDAKQPALTRLLVPGKLFTRSAWVPWALLAHNVARAAELGSGAMVTPYMPLVAAQVIPLVLYVLSTFPLSMNPEQDGMEFAPEWKSAGLPLIFQRSAKSPKLLPPVLKSSPPSNTSHGWEV